MRNRWISKLSALALWLGAAYLLGLWFGSVAWWLCAALALYLVFTLRNLYTLDRVIFGRGRLASFETRGFWAELTARVDKIRAKSRNRKQRYSQLIREVRESTGALSDGGIILNSDREILWFNPAATKLLGLDPARDIGHSIDNLLRHPDFVAYLANPGDTGIVIPSPVADLGMLSIQLIPYARNQRLAIIRDVTHQTRLERTRRDFVANASHELRSPLTVITGYLDTLEDDEELPETWRAPISEMLRQSQRMTQILRDLIELTRLESTDSKAQHDFVEVTEVLRGIVGEFEVRKTHPRLELRLESDAALLANESDLHSIFYNLISNAVRFTPSTGSITIVWRTGSFGAIFEVTDTGIGIAPEEIPRLTERFYRVDKGRSRASGGTGLGLAIVKHALQRHNGTLKIESQEGEGSTFRCEFEPRRVVLRGEVGEAIV